MKYSTTFLLLFTLLLSQCNSKKDENGTEQTRPNVLIIITDDQGYGDIGRHGNTIIKTPHLDQLHDESVRFTNFHVATTCAPTRAGLMTGLHCNRVGAWHTINGRSFIASRFPTMADHLKDAGYATGIFGKWHLGDNHPYRPQDRGFDEVLIHGGGGVGQTPDYWNNDYFDDTYFHNGVPKKYPGFCTDVWFNEAKYFISKVHNEGNPFFCYITTNAPHGPHHAPQSYIDLYKDNEDIVNPNFYGQITNIDDNIGTLMKSLKKQGIMDNTIVVFLTDNGTAAGASLDKEGHVTKGYNAGMRGRKVWEYEGGHRVPLFIRFPENMKIAPTTYSDLTTYTDILPTILDLTDTQPAKSKKYDGTSFYPLLSNKDQPELKDRVVIVDTQREDLVEKYKRSCVMQDQWRLINNKELYNMSEDPGQKQNVIEDHPDLAKTLSAAYEVWWEDFQNDISVDNLISIGHPNENPTLLTAHDYHAEDNSPWHQRHIREGILENGHWKLDVREAGNYTIKLFRWPPSLNIKMNDDVPEGDEVDGGKPFKPGLGFDIKTAQISIQNQQLESNTIQEDKYFQFDLTLSQGPVEFQSQLSFQDGKTVGAYYVEIEKIL